ncbi:UNVERIFIED_CONTAM: hypothetical protein NCL1_42376 [Trichonephila clavipes]
MFLGFVFYLIDSKTQKRNCITFTIRKALKLNFKLLKNTFQARCSLMTSDMEHDIAYSPCSFFELKVYGERL